MRKQNRRGDKPHDDERTDDDQPDSCGCTSELECFRHFESDDDPTAHTDGSLTRVSHSPELGDLYVISGSTYEVATFSDGGSTVVFEPIARPISEVVMPLNTVRTSDAVRYVQ